MMQGPMFFFGLSQMQGPHLFVPQSYSGAQHLISRSRQHSHSVRGRTPVQCARIAFLNSDNDFPASGRLRNLAGSRGMEGFRGHWSLEVLGVLESEPGSEESEEEELSSEDVMYSYGVLERRSRAVSLA